jgi:hypothetical protein
MTRINHVVEEIAKEFGFTNDEVLLFVRPEFRREDSMVGMQSLFDDEIFATADRRYERIYRILSDPTVAQTMPPGTIDEQGIQDMIDEGGLTAKLISKYREAVDESPTKISTGFEQLLCGFLEECIHAHMVHEICEYTIITVKSLLKCRTSTVGIRAASLGLISTSRSWDIINHDQRNVLRQLVKELVSMEDIIECLNAQTVSRRIMFRWKRILSEDHE